LRKAKEMTTQYIDATPTWEGITSSLLLIYEGSKKPKSRQWARDEILRMARLADQFVELTKDLNETKRKKG
tara:strand:- start:7007 stop:7219 length:213 start_codon:yes stop_codon:yes gene_type:complete